MKNLTRRTMISRSIVFVFNKLLYTSDVIERLVKIELLCGDDRFHTSLQAYSLVKISKFNCVCTKEVS